MLRCEPGFPVLAWAAVIFALSSISSLSAVTSAPGTRAARARTRRGVRGARCTARPCAAPAAACVRARRPVRGHRRDPPDLRLPPRRLGSLDVLADAVGRGRGRAGVEERSCWTKTEGRFAVGPEARRRPRRARRHAAALGRVARRRVTRARDRSGGASRRTAPPLPPSSTRPRVGNWRTLLVRYAEDRAPVYLRAGCPRGGRVAGTSGGGHARRRLHRRARGARRTWRSSTSARAGGSTRYMPARTPSRARWSELGDGARVVRTRADLLDGAAEG